MSISSIVREHTAFIWSVAVLRRLDCVLEPTKAAVLAEHKRLKGKFNASL
ncbi:MAG: type I restriction-modification system subunit M N-terminal domain-containing protein [Candidatus Dormibacteraeota bacterium]|nr:type I restriction-modification system subunit M N-terminal domain-containing protein [Candidatus Dormibacteraeota bacterium]